MAAIPVKFALSACISTKPEFGAGAAVFEGRYAIKNARARMRGEKKHLPWVRAELNIRKFDALPAVLHAGRYILHHTRLEFFHVGGRISLANAANTALVCGCIHAIGGALLPFSPPGSIQLHLEPDFSGCGSELCLSGMFCMRAGHIICAALIGAWIYISRRISHEKASH